MSELTKLLKNYALQKSTIDESHKKLLLCEDTGDWTQSRSLLSTLQNAVGVLTNEIAPNSEKFYSKLGSCDPITGLKRFGTNTEAKIVELKDSVQLFQCECQNILTLFTEKVELHCPVIIAPPATITASVLHTTDVKSEKDIELELQRVIQEKEEAEIAKKAQAVRERKALEASEQAQFDSDISTKLASFEKYINNVDDRVQSRLEQIRTNYQQTKNIKVGIELLKMAASIVERVVNKPDDSACRKLRVTHPVLLNKLTGLVGGIELMIAIGFRLKISLNSAEGAATSRVAAEDQKLSSSHSAAIKQVIAHIAASPSEPPIASTLDLFALLAPHTAWDASLEMTEPALDLSAASIGGKNAWIEWFDGLTHSRDAITEALKLMQ